jgi:hypothetical protein
VLPGPTPSATLATFTVTSISPSTLGASSANLSSSQDQGPLQKTVIWSLVVGSIGVVLAITVLFLIYCPRRRTVRSRVEDSDDGPRGRPSLPQRPTHLQEMEEIIIGRQELPLPTHELSEGRIQRAELNVPE